MWRPSSVWMPPGCTAVGADAVGLVAAVELDREEDVGGLGAAIGAELGIGRALEVRVVEIDVGEAVAGRRQVHQPRARLASAPRCG